MTKRASQGTGQKITATVEKILPYGVFVRLADGTQGYIRRREMSWFGDIDPRQLVQEEDIIEAIILHPGEQDRNVELSHRMTQADPWAEFTTRFSVGDVVQGIVKDLLPFGVYVEIIPGVDGLVQLGELAPWPVEKPDDVVWVNDNVEAVITRLNPHEKKVGLSIRRRIQQLSTLTSLVERLQLPSPAADSATPVTPHRQETHPPETDQDRFQRLAGIMRSRTPLSRRLWTGLRQLLAETDAEMGIIFHIDPTSHVISIMAQAGSIPLDEAALYTLQDSPVKDVIREGIPVLERNVSAEALNRFEKLQQLLPFESCIGVPVSARDETHHALFLFHRRPRTFNRFRLRDALAVAALFAVAIESQSLEERIQAAGSILLSGQLAAGLGHEVYNKILALELQLRNLQSDLRCASTQPPSPANEGLAEALELLLETGMDLKDTVGLFQSLMRADEGSEVDVNDVIRQTKAQLQPILGKERARANLDLSPGIPPVRGSAVRLRQVFLNLMLNAVQQMALKPAGQRLIQVTTSYEPDEVNHPVKVRFADTGPGIHNRLWQKVFDLGFSTRPGGTGLGLFIARSLIENMGGQLSIEQSIIPLRTTFLVALNTNTTTSPLSLSDTLQERGKQYEK